MNYVHVIAFIFFWNHNIYSQTISIFLNDSVKRTEINYTILASISKKYVVLENSAFNSGDDFKNRMHFWVSIFDNERWFKAESISTFSVKPNSFGENQGLKNQLPVIEIEYIRFVDISDYTYIKDLIEKFKEENSIINKNEWVVPCSFSFVFDNNRTVYIIYTSECDPKGEVFQDLLKIIKEPSLKDTSYDFFNWEEIIEIKK